MAKTSVLNRQLKREKLVRKYAAKRAELKRISSDLSLSPEERAFALRLEPGLSSAARTSHIETDLEEVPLSRGGLPATAAPSQLLTFRLRTGD